MPSLHLKGLSPVSSTEGYVFVAFKAYFDGGNKADNPNHKIITLAGISGSDIQWENFEKSWDKVCKKHHACYLHVTDLLAHQPPFTRELGWDDGRASEFLNDCVSVIERNAAEWPTDGTSGPRHKGIRLASSSVVLADFKRAYSEIPSIGSSTEQCAIMCCGLCISYGIHILEHNKFQFYFDQNEPYYGHIIDRKNNRKSLRDAPMYGRIVHCGESNMRDVPALQACDVLAWSINHQYEEGRTFYDWQDRMLNIQRDGDVLTYDRLRKPKMANRNIVNRWKLPKRAAPK